MNMNLSKMPMIPEVKVIEIIQEFRKYKDIKIVSEKTGISESSIHNILNDAKKKGIALPKRMRKQRRDWAAIIARLSDE